MFTLEIHKIKNKYITFITTEQGLYANSIPCDTKEQALRPMQKFLMKYDIQNSDKQIELAKLIYSFHINPRKEWKQMKEIPLDFLDYTEKQMKVLKELRKTEPGTTITYGELAQKSHLNNAARFVGTTMRNNRTPLFIPCHRVVQAGGKLGNYSSYGGAKQKQKYLKLEKVEH